MSRYTKLIGGNINLKKKITHVVLGHSMLYEVHIRGIATPYLCMAIYAPHLLVNKSYKTSMSLPPVALRDVFGTSKSATPSRSRRFFTFSSGSKDFKTKKVADLNSSGSVCFGLRFVYSSVFVL